MIYFCRACGNIDGNIKHTAREMMFGTREEFEYLECPVCGSVSIAEIPELAKHYPPNYLSFDKPVEPEIAKTFSRRVGSLFAGKYLRDGSNPIGKAVLQQKPWLLDHYPQSFLKGPLKLKADSAILDFGCGNGRLLQDLHYFGFTDLIGIDKFIVDEINYDTGVKITKKPLAEIDKKFDLIMLHHSFEHLPGPLEILADIRNALKPDGRALIRIPVVNYAWEKYGVNWVQLDPPRHLILFSETGLRHLAESVGLAVEEVIYDSDAFQFWGSEQYLLDIPLNDASSHNVDMANGPFSPEQIEKWRSEAQELNVTGCGDQACFYLKIG